MKTAAKILIALLFIGYQVQGQTYFYKNGVQFISDSTRPDYILLDSVKANIYDHNPPDTLYFYYSAWIPNYTFYLEDNVNNGTMEKYFSVTSHQLDSTNGLVKVPLGYYPSIPAGDTLKVSIGLAPVFVTVNLLGDNNYYVTGISSGIQTTKTGTVNIYDSQGRFVKNSQVANYTEGLSPDQLYIYNIVYSDGSVAKGKFILQ